MKAHLVVAVSATMLAGSAIAASGTIPKRGMIYAWTEGGLPSLRSEPKSDSPAVAHAPNGARVRFVEVAGSESDPTWYHVDQLGIPSGWLERKQARTDAAPRPASQPLPTVDLGDLSLRTGTVMTSAARGLDARVLSYGADATRVDALQQLANLRSAVDRQMRDVPYTGKPPEKPGHVPGSRPDHTAQGRLDDAKQFHDGLSPEAAK